MSGTAQSYFIATQNVESRPGRKMELWERNIYFVNSRLLRLTNDGRTHRAANNNCAGHAVSVVRMQHKSVL